MPTIPAWVPPIPGRSTLDNQSNVNASKAQKSLVVFLHSVRVLHMGSQDLLAFGVKFKRQTSQGLAVDEKNKRKKYEVQFYMY